jgi:hypothetical protein
MPASERLPAHLTRAIKSGRAITLLADYRPAELTGLSLTVIGLIDRVSFEGVLLSDDEPNTEFVRLPLPDGACGDVPEIRTDSADARAIHEPWSLWHCGVRDGYLRFTRTIATALSLARPDEALRGASVVGDDPEASAPHPKKRRSKPPAGSQRKSGGSAGHASKARGDE